MPNASDIPFPVKRFIHDCITSAAQLEALLLLAEQAHTDWTATEVSAELRSTPALMETALTELHASRLLAATDAPTEKETEPEMRYRYQPDSNDLEQTVAALSKIYRERRHSVLTAIYSPREPDSLRAFSDAFRLRREE